MTREEIIKDVEQTIAEWQEDIEDFERDAPWDKQIIEAETVSIGRLTF